MIRTAKAVWEKSLGAGRGAISLGSGVLKDTPYSFKTRFEADPGTNPEELLAAAHAACFSMALAAELEKAAATPQCISTNSEITFEKTKEGWSITGIHLRVDVAATGADEKLIHETAQIAKRHCPVSRALNVPISVDASPAIVSAA